MSTWLLATIGGRDGLGRILYALTRDGETVLHRCTYSEGLDHAVEHIGRADLYREACAGRVYCEMTARRFWFSHLRMQRWLGRRGSGVGWTREQARAWLTGRAQP